MNKVQQAVEAVPTWGNWTIMVASAITAWLAPVAALVTIVWGCLQAYIAWQKYKHWKRSVGEG